MVYVVYNIYYIYSNMSNCLYVKFSFATSEHIFRVYVTTLIKTLTVWIILNHSFVV